MILLASCNQSEDIQLPSADIDKQPNKPMGIEARATALFVELNQGTLREGSAVTISSIDSMETTTPDTKLYATNFEDGGFLLFRDGGEEEMNLLGYSEASTLHLSDCEEHPILQQIILNSTKMTPDGFSTELLPPNNGDTPPGTPSEPKPPRIDFDIREFNTEVITSQTYYAKNWFEPQTYLFFNQRTPFNDLVKDQHLAGCGPIAIATILSHYEKQAGGSQVDWGLLKRKYNNSYWDVETLKDENPKLLLELQRLVADAWLYAHILSTKGYTMSTPANVAGYLRRAGFHVAYQHEYNSKKVCNDLKRKHQPFILMGWNKKNKKKKAHYWVVDGLRQKMLKESGYTTNSITGEVRSFERTSSTPYYHIHCTWGWGGNYNGWFNPQVINPYEPVEELRSSHPSGEYYNFWTFFIWE